MEALVFNIQKFSIHDGPGIRTTVFFKGCPLKCKWCANPESQKVEIEIIHNNGKCKHCLKCINYYPELKFDGKNIIVPKGFNDLEIMNICPNRAFEVEGEYKNIEDIVKTCLQDLPFYEESGGGVTISGGEGMVQPESLKALIKALKEYNIHLAIETTGAVNSETFKEISSMLDFILFDVKHYDSKRHKEGTGVGNEIILENLKWLINENIEYLVRIPVIPGFNDSIEDAKKFSKLFDRYNIKKVQLLPFHQFGESKYDLLNRSYNYKGVKAYHPEDLEIYRDQFKQEGIEAFF